MSKNTTVSITLQLRGTAGKDLSRITTEQINQTQKINANWNMATTAQAKFTDQLRRSTTETKQASGASDQLLRTNRMLEGVLRQQAIQTRLISGQLKAQNRDYSLQTRMLSEQARHAKDLQRALADAARSQRDMSHTGGGGGFVGRAGGLMMGAAAAYGVVRTPLERARSFETKIFDATTSVTGGFNGMNHDQVKSANLTLSQYAKDAVRVGHGSVDGVGDAAGILAASGLYRSIDELKYPLIAIAKSAFASGSSEQDMAELAKQIRQFGIAPKDTQTALDRATQSGFAGGFEIRDMSRFLPEVLPFASKAGYRGQEGFDQVTTHLQLARKYTGIPGQAATNVQDLYNLLGQNHFALSIGKYIKPEKGDPIRKIGLRGNRMGFDINRYLASERENGVNTVDATINLMDRQLNKNKNFRRLSSDIKGMEDEQRVTGKPAAGLSDKKAALEIVIAGEFGKIFHNQQSLSALTAVLAGRATGESNRILNQVQQQGDGTVARVSSEKSQIEPAQAHAREQEAILATIKVYDAVKETLGKFEDGLTNTMQANQALTAAAYAAAGALTILAGVKMGAAVVGGGAGAAAAGGAGAWIAGKVTAAMGLGRTGVGALAGSTIGRLALGLGVGTAGSLGYWGGSKIYNNMSESSQNVVGGTIATILANLGIKEAQDALNTEMTTLSSELPRQNERMIQQNDTVIALLQKSNSSVPPTSTDLMSGLSQSLTQESRRGMPYRP
ncbi:MAG: hypothetical protein RLY58_532 [Pseudomonadota bacterium]|jgi:hypothetical protein